MLAEEVLIRLQRVFVLLMDAPLWLVRFEVDGWRREVSWWVDTVGRLQ